MMNFTLNCWWVFALVFILFFYMMTNAASMAARNPSREAIRSYAIFMFCAVLSGAFLFLGLMGQMVAYVLSVSHSH